MINYVETQTPKGGMLRCDLAASCRSTHYEYTAKQTFFCPETQAILSVSHSYMHWLVGSKFGYKVKLISAGSLDITKPGGPFWIAPQKQVAPMFWADGRTADPYLQQGEWE